MTPLTYREWRALEGLLARYMGMIGSGQIVEHLRYVTRDAASRAGKAQRAETRICSWCHTAHTDVTPDLCDDCAHKSKTMVTEEGRRA